MNEKQREWVGLLWERLALAYHELKMDFGGNDRLQDPLYTYPACWTAQPWKIRQIEAVKALRGCQDTGFVLLFMLVTVVFLECEKDVLCP